MASPTSSRWAVAALALVVIAFAGYLGTRFEAATVARDAHGYVGQAVLYGEEHRWTRTFEHPLEYRNFQWVQGQNGVHHRLAPGWGLLGMVAYWVGGLDAVLVVNIALAVGALLVVGLLGRAWMGPWWGAAAAVAVACTPPFARHALINDSHMASALLLVGALYAIERWRRTDGTAYACAAGLLVGVMPAVRYPEVFLAATVAGFAVWVGAREPPRRRQLAVAALVALVPVALLAWHHAQFFGAPWRTGYAGEASEFGLAHFARHAPTYAAFMFREGAGPVLVLSFALGVPAVIATGARRAEAVWALVAALGMAVIYYSFHADAVVAPLHLRYMVPALSVMALVGLMGIRCWWRLLERRAAVARRRWALPLVVIALVAGHAVSGLGRIDADARTIAQQRRYLRRAAQLARAHTGAADVIVTSDQFAQYLDLLGRFRLVDDARLQPAATETVRRLQEWADSGRIYWLGTEQRLTRLERRGGLTAIVVATQPLESVIADAQPDAIVGGLFIGARADERDPRLVLVRLR